jgi:very-short-patch-repair endonuclease
MSKIPQAMSVGEETFALHCRAYNLSPEREVQFDPKRKWRFDFAWPDRKLAVEVEGGTSFGRSRHSKGEGFERDINKYNRASRMGWMILRFTTAMVIRGEAIKEVLEVLNELTIEGSGAANAGRILPAFEERA